MNVRLAVVSDIHGNLPALQAVHDEIQRAAVDAVVNLGDIASGPLWPRETVDWLMARDWLTIRGNHERQLQGERARMGLSDAFAFDALGDEHKAWLAALPAGQSLGDDVQLIHGTPASDLHYLLETVTGGSLPGIRAATDGEVRSRLGTAAPSLLLCGHTHVPRVVQAGATLIVNPGSVGLQAFDDSRPFAHHVEAGSPHARWALVERVAAGWRVELRLTAYDWQAAAQRAQANGRGDWADALRSGRVGRTEADLSA